MLAKIRQAIFSLKALIGGTAVTIVGFGNLFFNFFESGALFRFLYSPILGLVGLLFLAGGLFGIVDLFISKK